ncbi:MAG: HAMP domain-containing sensor histidine kinase [Sulfurimonas sp.]|jgi:C4-dicarboxylate-specific signal transduction histidine kinase
MELNIYILIILLAGSVFLFFYLFKMNEARALILKQQNDFLDSTTQLEKQVNERTLELQKLNESLERRIENKEVELMQKDKLLTAQAKQAVMGEMINMIAHQWRQPLSTITLQIANYQFQQLLGENRKVREVDKVLDEISNSILYLSDTVDDFQTYFAPNKEKNEIEIHELLQKAVYFVMPRLKESAIEIVIDKSEEVIINTYMNEIIQVLLNLLNNAIDSLMEVKKEHPKVTLSIEDKDETLLILVEDNSSGISEENVLKIFEPYFSTKGKNGTGLGLYMSQMIIQKQFNGTISVQTSPNGSIFTVEIVKKLF